MHGASLGQAAKQGVHHGGGHQVAGGVVQRLHRQRNRLAPHGIAVAQPFQRGGTVAVHQHVSLRQQVVEHGAIMRPSQVEAHAAFAKRDFRDDTGLVPVRRIDTQDVGAELNASTFATRVAISTGASLAPGVLAGFTTLTGPLHGGAARQFAQLIARAQAGSADDAVRDWLAGGRPLPAFGHPL